MREYRTYFQLGQSWGHNESRVDRRITQI
ncbi:hypothetical protein [Lyngbya aestuarii]